MKPTVNQSYLMNVAKNILEQDSPTGYCFDVIEQVRQMVQEMGYEMTTNEKGCGFVTVPGESDEKVIGLSAHLDTLGLMVRSISASGTLKVINIGGPIIPTLDAEYCKIRTRQGKTYTGTILSTSPAVHVYEDASSLERNINNIEVRIDEVVKNAQDVKDLGICAGDFIFIDPKTTVTPSGFLKSRFIDDKGSAACLLTLLQMMSEQKLKPRYKTIVIFSIYEEVGHGAAHIPSEITEYIAVDMGCIGLDLTCTEYDVSICAKDSSGPYDYKMTSQLIELAKKYDIPYAVDIYPRYASDVTAAYGAGNNIRGALIGPGVHASHGMERTHWKALEGTVQLLYLYLTQPAEKNR